MAPFSKTSRGQRLALAALAFGLASSGAGIVLWYDPEPIFIQSLESETYENQPVYNRIQFVPGAREDIWVMQQSHDGPPRAGHEFHRWDRLVIRVDKTRTPKFARFDQVEAGEGVPGPGAQPRPLRASCFMCHNNGPRAIRPELASPASQEARLGLKDRARLLLWNLRIKTYGRVLSESARPSNGGKTPFRYAGEAENRELQVRACVRCHQEGRWTRGGLRFQQAGTIKFMVERGLMPPPGFSVLESERRELWKFVRGF